MAKLTQEQLLEIFNAVKKEMKPYEKGTVKALTDIEGKYDLWSVKKISVLNKQRDGMGFVTLILQSSYVGFYYTPIYTDTDYVRNRVSPDLLKHLKGKGCFHIKSADKELMKHIKEAMKIGYEAYKKQDWV